MNKTRFIKNISCFMTAMTTAILFIAFTNVTSDVFASSVIEDTDSMNTIENSMEIESEDEGMTLIVSGGDENDGLASKKEKYLHFKSEKDSSVDVDGEPVNLLSINNSSIEQNYKTLKNYILNNGKYDEDLECYIIEGKYRIGEITFKYSFDYDPDLGMVQLWLFSDQEDEAGRTGTIVVDVDLNGDADPMCFIDFDDEEEIDMDCTVSAEQITPQNHLNWSVYENESSFTGKEASIQNYCNSFLDLSLEIWEKKLQTTTGLALSDLGFTSYITQYTVKYDANGGTGYMNDSVFTWDLVLIVPECEFILEGFHFVGWCNSPTVTSKSKVYYVGDEVSSRDFTAGSQDNTDDSSMVLYALWAKDQEGAEHIHTLQKVDKVAPTCAVPGYEAYYICIECLKMFSDAEATCEITGAVEIPSAGIPHKWGKWGVSKAPTTSKKGTLSAKCKVCSKKKTRSIPKLKAKYKGSFKGKKKTIRVDTGKKKAYLVFVTLVPTRKYNSNDTISFTLSGKSFTGKKYKSYKDSDSVKHNKKKCYYWYTSGKDLKPGRYTITLKSKKGRTYKVKYKVKRYSSYVTQIKTKKTLTSINGWDWLNVKAVKPSKGLLWGKIKSSNPKVISAYYDPYNQKFYIEGHKKPGKATITITLANGKKYKMKAQIYEPFLYWNSYSLYIGQKFKDPFYNYTGKVKYWSSNKKVAKVSKNGTVKAVGYGTCYIYAKGGKWKDKTKVISSYKNVRKGMTKAQVRRSSWESPDHTASASGGWSFWYYDDGSYVYFKKGRVKYWYNAAG